MIHKSKYIAHNKNMKELKTIEKTTEELNELEKQILDEHTEKTSSQLSHYLELKKQKLYLKKKLNAKHAEDVKNEIKNFMDTKQQKQ